MRKEKEVHILQGLPKLCGLLSTTLLAAWGSHAIGLATTPLSLVSVSAFIFVICTILFCSQYRLAAACGCVAVLIATRAMTLDSVLRYTQLDIILFLIGMMIIVGVLKDIGFMTWIIQSILNRKKMTGFSFTVILCLFSALLSSVLGEVSSIVVVLALVFQVCETLKIRATPFVLMAVLCTNIGSPMTMLGNPVGIFIGNKAGFTFTQFLQIATPVSLCCLMATLVLLLIWYRRDIQSMTRLMQEHRKQNQGLGPLLRIPYKRGLFILLATVTIIAFHHQIESALGLLAFGSANKNAFLIITPLVIASALMIYRPKRTSYYVEHDVEWETLLFFMMLFAISGSMEVQHVTGHLAEKLGALAKGGPSILALTVVGLSAVGSAFIDNMTFVAAFSPAIEELVRQSADYNILWWALLFGACFGGNITVIGSTANIVALGMLEKRSHMTISFLEWVKVGLAVGAVTSLIAWGLLLVFPSPQPAARAEAPVVQNLLPPTQR